MGHLALQRVIRHAEANDLVSRNVAALADTPEGQHGRPSKSLTLDQAVAVITATKALPVMELRPGLKDVRRPAALMHAYIVLSLLAGIRTEEARALRWQHVDLDGNPAANPPVPPHVAVWRSVRVRGETKTERSRRTLGLPAVTVQTLRALWETQADERLTTGDDWQDTELVFTTHRGAALDAGDVRKMFKRVCTEAGIGDGWTPRELRTSFVSLMSHHGVSIEEIARLVGHASTRTTEIVYRRDCDRSSPQAPRSWISSSQEPSPPHQARIPPRTCTGRPPIPGCLWNSTSRPWPAKAPLKRPWRSENRLAWVLLRAEQGHARTRLELSPDCYAGTMESVHWHFEHHTLERKLPSLNIPAMFVLSAASPIPPGTASPRQR
jgi:integrase